MTGTLETVESPLGKTEGIDLEFKRAESLKSPGAIAREVVSMLNGKGGTIWIGIAEASGRAIEEQDIPEVEKAVESLDQALCDRIVPREGHRVRVVPVITRNGNRVIRIDVMPMEPNAGPFAALDDGPRFYGRISSRVRALTWDEVRERFGSEDTRSKTDLSDAHEELEGRIDEVLARSGEYFALLLQPVGTASFDITSNDLKASLVDAALVGNRRDGWTYASDGRWTSDDGKGWILRGYKNAREIGLSDYGGLVFLVSLEWMLVRDLQPADKQIHALALLEYTVSFLRLAAYLYRDRPGVSTVLIDALVTGGKGWSLPQFAPNTYGYMLNRGPEPLQPDKRLDDYRRRAPLAVQRVDLLENPDRVAFQLVRDFYAWWGLPEDRVPNAYDRQTERFTLKG